MLLSIWLMSAVISFLYLAEIFKDEADYERIMLLSAIMSLIMGPLLAAPLVFLDVVSKFLFK